VAQTKAEGRALEFDFPALRVGVADDPRGPTGVTVFWFPARVSAAVDVRGGAPGTAETDLLRLGYEEPTVDAIVFAGGSAYGLEASAGVRAELLATGERGTGFDRVAVVPSAIVYDWGGRNNAHYPDAELGRAALRAARSGHFPLGAHGAGSHVSVGKYFGPRYRERAGQGGAFRQVG
jgi:L-aminopeptidase/D-esterase-like protein